MTLDEIINYGENRQRLLMSMTPEASAMFRLFHNDFVAECFLTLAREIKELKENQPVLGGFSQKELCRLTGILEENDK